MKKPMAFVAALIPFILSAQNTVVIQATIQGLQGGEKVYYRPIRTKITDSAISKPGNFTLRIPIPEGEGNAYLLHIGNSTDEDFYKVLYLDKGTVIITGKGPGFKNAKYAGSSSSMKDMNDYESFLDSHESMRHMDSLVEKMEALNAKGDTAAFNALNPEWERLDSVRTILSKKWISQHTSSPVSAFILDGLQYKLSMSELETIMNGLTAGAKNNVEARIVQHKIKVDKLTGIGQEALEFAQTDTSGKMVALKDFRGKYVLIDFWASWCHPCREENPNVLKAYNMYKDKNFTVLGVSFDKEKDNWLAAIHKDGLLWSQVSDLNGWENAVGKQYAIESIPSNFLIDPSGKIIAKDLSGDALANKLAEVLKN